MESNFLVLKNRHRIVKLDLDQVTNVEVDDYLFTVYCQESNSHHCCRPLKEIARQLPPSFQKINRSYIINPNHIQEINVRKKEILLTCGVWLPVSRSQWKNIREVLPEGFTNLL